jgi:hypothetical protein
MTETRKFAAKPEAADAFLAKYPQPIVLHFQPEQFSLMETKEDLQQWETDLARRVGMQPSVARRFVEATQLNGGTCCESGDTNDCDAD